MGGLGERVADGVGDDDIDTAELVNGFLDGALAVLFEPCVLFC